MGTTKKKQADDNEQVQEQVEGAPTNKDLGRDVGFIGTKVDPRDNSEHSLASGPDSPSSFEQAKDALDQRAEDLEASNS